MYGVEGVDLREAARKLSEENIIGESSPAAEDAELLASSPLADFERMNRSFSGERACDMRLLPSNRRVLLWKTLLAA